MVSYEKINLWAQKWRKNFLTQNINQEKESGLFNKECFSLGFELTQIDNYTCKHSDASLKDPKQLKTIISKIQDVHLLGSIIFSKWRYITHWTSDSVLEPHHRDWFIIALSQLIKLTEKSEAKNTIEATITQNNMVRIVQLIITLVNPQKPTSIKRAKIILNELYGMVFDADVHDVDLVWMKRVIYYFDKLVAKRDKFARIKGQHSENSHKRELLRNEFNCIDSGGEYRG